MKYSFLSLLLLLFIGCNSDDGNSNDSNAILIKRSVNGSSTFEYSYNGNKITEINIGSIKIVYSYTGDLITKIKRYYLSSSQLEFETDFTYDANQKLIEERILYYESGTAEKRVFTYNSNGTISFQQYSGNFSNQNTAGNSGIIYLNTFGDVNKVELFDGINLIRKTEYIHDAKNSILKNILGYNKLISIFDSGKVNNIISSTTYDGSGVVIDGFSNVYTYNSDDFPVMVTTVVNGNSVPYPTEYFY